MEDHEYSLPGFRSHLHYVHPLQRPPLDFCHVSRPPSCEANLCSSNAARQVGPSGHSLRLLPCLITAEVRCSESARPLASWLPDGRQTRRGDHEYHTLRREELFRNPPRDHTAYPSLQIAVDPHIESFNALFPTDGSPGLIAHGIADIGPKSYLDGGDATPPAQRNKLTIRYKSVHLQKALLPPDKQVCEGPRDLSGRVQRATRHLPWQTDRRLRVSNKRRRSPGICARDRPGADNGQGKHSPQSPWHVGQPLTFSVEQMPPGKQLAGTAGPKKGGGRGAGRLLHRQRHRKDRPSPAPQPPQLSPWPYTGRVSSTAEPTTLHHGIILRSVRPDETSQTNVLHYLKDGNVTFRFSWRKSEYLVPVMMVLKALVETNDYEIAQGLVGSGRLEGRRQYLSDGFAWRCSCAPTTTTGSTPSLRPAPSSERSSASSLAFRRLCRTTTWGPSFFARSSWSILAVSTLPSNRTRTSFGCFSS